MNEHEIFTFEVGSFATNCYMVTSRIGPQCVIIDPGDEAERLFEELKRRSLEPVAIMITHGHLDHVGGVGPLKKAFDVPVYVHELDLPLYNSVSEQGEWFGLNLVDPPPPEHYFVETDSLVVGPFKFKVIHTPGHTPGHISLLSGEDIFVGDCLFAGSIGRTDLPGGSHELLIKSIKEKILPLPDNTVVRPGHGPMTTVMRERSSNPFFGSFI